MSRPFTLSLTITEVDSSFDRLRTNERKQNLVMIQRVVRNSREANKTCLCRSNLLLYNSYTVNNWKERRR